MQTCIRAYIHRYAGTWITKIDTTRKKERKKERKGKERKGKERKGKERKIDNYFPAYIHAFIHS